LKRFDVIALGELLIDFTENSISNSGNPIFEANPGGAPCNVLSMLSKLGRSTAFIGKVGDDSFGHMLKREIDSSFINSDNLFFDKYTHTTLAFVHKTESGDRSFSFYRNPGADMMLEKDEISADFIRTGKIFHFGSLSSTHEKNREATRYALEIAKENKLLVSFDPNLRENLWDSLDHAKSEIEYGFSKCDILKISDNELEFMTGTSDFSKGVSIIRKKNDIPLIFVTMGKNGSRAYFEDFFVEASPFIQKNTIDTTGAGDTFTACVLDGILNCSLSSLSRERLLEMITFANAASSIVTTRKGALKVMPEKEEILSLLK
jgi:fructokinase